MKFELLQVLAHGESDMFREFGAAQPGTISHLEGYGIVRKGLAAYVFSIGIVKEFMLASEKPTVLTSIKDRWSEIQQSRTNIELDLRKLIHSVWCIRVVKSRRHSELMKSLSARRRDGLAGIDFEGLLGMESPLYFGELIDIVLGNWGMFENVVEASKSSFEVFGGAINKYRQDAHPKSVSEDEFNDFRTYARQMRAALSD